MLSDFFLTDLHKSAIAMEYSYNYWLAGLSFIIAVFASYTAFMVLRQVIAAPNRIARLNWLVTGAISMGSGVWAMHFVAMLAVQMDHEMRYEPKLTALSLVFAVLASGFAFDFVARGTRQTLRLAISGAVLGAGIGLMHYTGMLAMRMHGVIRYDPVLFGVSIVVAVVLAILALRLMFYGAEKRETANRAKNMVTAGVMGLSVSLMHYTGMSATTFLDHQPQLSDPLGIALGGWMVAATVGGVAIAITGLAWFAANIDQRMSNKDMALQQSQGMLEAFIDTALDGIFTFDERGILKSFNPAGTKIFGFSPEESIGQHLSMLFPTFDLAGDDGSSSIVELIENKTGSKGTEIEATRKDGSTRILEMSLSEMRLIGQRFYTAIVRDVTERHETAIALRTSQQRLNVIVNSVASAVIAIDGEGVIRSYNVSAERIFKHSVAEANGMSFSSLLPESGREEHERNLALFIEKGTSSFIGKYHETTGLRKGDAIFPMEIWLNWMEVGDEIWFVAVCRDITARKEAEQVRAALEQELRQAQKMESLGVLSGGIAHEINTPVQYIGDNIRFLESSFSDLQPIYEQFKKLLEIGADQDVTPDMLAQAGTAAEEADLDFLLTEIPAAIEQSLEGVAQISEIVQAIKEFSHPDTKEKTVVDINRAIQTTIAVARNQWKYVADVETDLDDSLPPVSCLVGELNQVILNLIVNSAHAIEDAKGDDDSKGRIAISTSHDEDSVTLAVSDTGCGIAPEAIEKIFDPFYTTKEPGRGTGQGLSISHNIITKKHGGSFNVRSEVGQGTTFTISLPLDRGPQQQAAAE